MFVRVSDVTQILKAIESGDPRATEQQLPLVYQELRRLAAVQMAREKPGQTLDATALVHEAYLRLVDNEPEWNSRGHFFAAAAEAMRRILIDTARRKQAEVHGGGRQRVDFAEAKAIFSAPPENLLAFDEVLDRLARQDPVAAQMVKLRYFAGLSVEQAAKAQGLSRTQAYRLWTFVRAWLCRQLAGDGEEPNS